MQEKQKKLQDTLKEVAALKKELQDEAKKRAAAIPVPCTSPCCAQPPLLAPPPCIQSFVTGQSSKMVQLLPPSHDHSSQNSLTAHTETGTSPVPVILVPLTSHSYGKNRNSQFLIFIQQSNAFNDFQ
uniref:Uncharacterized protein n=1 Tax=Trichogramma kaykai TaxID=54128 RepID=A0ABD2WHH4_9HYME